MRSGGALLLALAHAVSAAASDVPVVPEKVSVSFDRWNCGLEWVMPVGAGDLSAMVSVVSNAVELHLSKTDYLAEVNPGHSMGKGLQLVSPGHVTIPFDNLATNDFTAFRQTLDPVRGMVTVTIGTAAGTIETVIYGDRTSGALVCDIADTRPDGGVPRPACSVWRSGKGICPEYPVFVDVKDGSVIVSCGAESRRKALATTRTSRRLALADWWRSFWAKGYVVLDGTPDAEYLTRLWWVNLYSYASVGYGPVPPKFNGGPGLVDGDRRHWGKDLWYQNTRELIWPMCVAGHPEFAKAILDFYDACLENAYWNTARRYPDLAGTEALVLPETMPFLDNRRWTKPPAEMPDVRRPYREPTDAERSASAALRRARKAAFVTHVYSSGVELLHQRIDYMRFTGDRSALPKVAQWLRGLAETYFVLLNREADGRWHVRATNVNESWWVRDDSIVDLAAAHYLFTLVDAHGAAFGYPPNLIDAARERLRNLAPYPTVERIDWGRLKFFDVARVVPGDRIFAPCAPESLVVGETKKNCENNEMYLVFPFAFCETGAMRALALRTFPETFNSDCTVWGWNPESVVAVRLRLPDAAERVLAHARATATWPYGGGRSPGLLLYEGAQVEDVPYFDGTCVTLTGIQELLLQSHPAEPSVDLFGGGEVVRFPCPLPKGWRARFRLCARGEKTVEGDRRF